jgi:KAP family P-loop domain
MNKTPLYVSPVTIKAEDTAFHGDLFNRVDLAQRLKDCIDRLPSGGVIAIDAAWGEGKSWFGQHWHNQLKADGYRTAFINAFERDYVDEPFVMLVSELLASLNGSEKSKLKTSGAAVAKAIVPLAAKGVINAVVHLATGATDFSEKFDQQLEKAGAAIAAGAEKLLSKQIEEYEKSKTAVSGFRKTLRDLAADQNKPIVIFIDELDRCKPEFALKLIERAKHFFEMPNVVFVLLLNRDQLSKAVKGVYGPEIDGDRYLSKFLHLCVSLPKQIYSGNSGDAVRKFAGLTVNRYGLSHLSGVDHWAAEISGCSVMLNLSPRDIERCVGLLALSQNNSQIQMWMLAWPIALKIGRPELFAGLLAGNLNAHERAQTLVTTKQTQASIQVFSADVFKEIHQAILENRDFNANDKEVARFFGSYVDNGIGYPINLCDRILRTVDLNIK